MRPNDRIIIDPNVLVGKPILRGTRISVELLLELLSNGWSHEEILKNYPQIRRVDILAALKYAAISEGRTRVPRTTEGKSVTFIADENIPYEVIKRLRGAGAAIISVPEEFRDMSDERIMKV